MLQIYKSSSVQGGEGEAAPSFLRAAEPSLAEQFAAVIGFIRRQFLVVLAFIPLTIGLAAAYLFTTPPVYLGRATMIFIDTGKAQTFQQSILGFDPINAVMVDTQIEIMRSENFALSIVKDLNLTHDPEFVVPGGICTAINLLFHPTWLSCLFKSTEPKSESDFTRRAVDTFEKRLKVNRVGMTDAVEITFPSGNPERAAQLTNAVADEFITHQLEAKYQTIGQATAWLQDRLNELLAQASAADRAVVEYKTKNNIVDTGGRLINEQQLSELNTALVKARADSVEAKARLDRLSQILRNDDLDPASKELAAVTDSLKSDIISKLRGQYLELAQRVALYLPRLGNEHLAVVNLRNQMREIRHSIVDQMRQIAEAYKSDYDIAKAREDSLEGSMAASVAGSQMTNRAQIELRQLESAAKSYRTLYDSFQQHYMDSVQQQSFPMSEARIITRASPPLYKNSPKSFLVLGVAVFGGLVLGLGLAILREIADRVFRTSSQVEAKLKTVCLALVPAIKPSAKAKSLGIKAATKIGAPRIIAANAGLPWYVVNSPLSRFAESIRAVKVGADVTNAAKPNRVIGITSSLPNEGKSTISASLALLSAHAGARVILVDCDLRNPSLSRDLVPIAAPGLIDVLTESASLNEVIWSVPSTKLSFLPAGAKPHLIHTNEILASDAVRRLFDLLRESYDYVIVDLSPIAPVVDVRSTGHFVDSYVFVVEWGKTTIGVVEHALTSARGVYENLLGVVLNKVNLKQMISYDRHRSNYYYNSHYGKYGYTE